MEYQQNYSPTTRRDDNILSQILNYKKGIVNLKLQWRGWERDEAGKWVKTETSDSQRIMNEKGIHWAVSILENYLDEVFQTTNWDEDHMNFEMRELYRVVWFGLATQYLDFKMSKINVQLVAHQLTSRVHAMMLASRAEGIRKFVQTTGTVTEHKISDGSQQRGMFSGISSMFSRGGQQN